MRALLLYNPYATTTRPVVTDLIVDALSDELKLDVSATECREHASHLAAGAVHEGYEVLIVLGGDGTVNEAIQGLAHSPVRLAIIPGGSTNVWARTLGLPNDPLTATGDLLRRIRERSERTVNLGSANGRYFGVNAGFGFDAEVVRYVERRHRLKRRVRQASFLYCALLAYADGFARRGVDIAVAADDDEPVPGLRSVVCCNSDPYTFLGPRAARACPLADLALRLDLTALTALSVGGLGRLARAALASAGVGDVREVRSWHDRERFTLISSAPLPLQVDGDFVGEATSVRLCTVPNALIVVA